MSVKTHKWTNEEIVSYLMALRHHLSGVQEALACFERLKWQAPDKVARADLQDFHDCLVEAQTHLKQAQYRVAAL